MSLPHSIISAAKPRAPAAPLPTVAIGWAPAAKELEATLEGLGVAPTKLFAPVLVVVDPPVEVDPDPVEVSVAPEVLLDLDEPLLVRVYKVVLPIVLFKVEVPEVTVVTMGSVAIGVEEAPVWVAPAP